MNQRGSMVKSIVKRLDLAKEGKSSIEKKVGKILYSNTKKDKEMNMTLKNSRKIRDQA